MLAEDTWTIIIEFLDYDGKFLLRFMNKHLYSLSTPYIPLFISDMEDGRNFRKYFKISCRNPFLLKYAMKYIPSNTFSGKKVGIVELLFLDACRYHQYELARFILNKKKCSIFFDMSNGPYSATKMGNLLIDAISRDDRAEVYRLLSAVNHFMKDAVNMYDTEFQEINSALMEFGYESRLLIPRSYNNKYGQNHQ